MLLSYNNLILKVSAVTSRRVVSILFNRVAILILLYSGIIACIYTGIGIYNGLFHSTAVRHSFDLFIDIIGVIILCFSPESCNVGNSTDLASISLAVIPLVVYSNADVEKQSIKKENKGKSGVYM
jgi:hypothetical protein